MRMSLSKLPRHSVSTDKHPTVETTNSDEFPYFRFMQGTLRSNLTQGMGLTVKFVTQVNSANLFVDVLLDIWKYISGVW